LMKHCVENLTRTLEKAKQKDPKNAVCVQSLLGALTMDIISACALGTDIDSIEDPNNPIVVHAKRVLEDFEAGFGMFILMAFPYTTAKIVPNLAKKLLDRGSSDYLKGVALQIIDERRRNPQVSTSEQKHGNESTP